MDNVRLTQPSFIGRREGSFCLLWCHFLAPLIVISWAANTAFFAICVLCLAAFECLSAFPKSWKHARVRPHDALLRISHVRHILSKVGYIPEHNLEL